MITKKNYLGVIAGTLCLSLATVCCAVAQEATHRLAKGNLSVDIMEPNAPDRYYRGVRFSPLATVMQVTTDNGATFLFCPEKHNPLTDNAGLAMEFDITNPKGPPGYTEADLGEPFVKVGVGVLKKTTERYRFWEPYPVVALAKSSVTWEKERATFTQQCEGTNGYAYELSATVVLVGDSTVTLTYALKNSGTKAFRTEHYTHNFFRFSDRDIGPGYRMHFGRELPASIDPKMATRQGAELIFEKAFTKPANIELSPLASAGTPESPVTITNDATGQSITFSTSAPLLRTSIHVAPPYLCPEQFVQVNLAPGETATWERHYEFRPLSVSTHE